MKEKGNTHGPENTYSTPKELKTYLESTFPDYMVEVNRVRSSRGRLFFGPKTYEAIVFTVGTDGIRDIQQAFQVTLKR